MIVDFLNRLEFVLGSRIQGSSDARVAVAPGPNINNRPRVLLSTEHLELTPARLGDRQDMVVPGDANPRRVVRAKWSTRLRVIPTNQGGPGEAREVLDVCLYELDAPDFRNGQAFADGGPPDPGFQVDALSITSLEAPFDGVDGNDPNTDLLIHSEGVLWPAGEVGEAGIQIANVFLRGVLMPMALAPVRLVANAGATDLSLNVRPFLQMQEGATSGTFTSLALQVLDETFATRTDALQGAVNGVLITAVTGEQLNLTYTPPADAATETLVVSLDDNEDNPGMELARFTLNVQAPE